MALAICVLVVLLVFGVFSSKSVSPTGRPAGVLASWQKLTFGGLSFYAPGDWPISRQDSWGACGGPDQPMQASSVVLNTGANGENVTCELISTSLHPAYGLLVDPGPNGILSMVSGFEKCLKINALSVCPSSTTYPSFHVFAVHIAGVKRPVAVEIGVAGGGKIAQTILYSMRPSVSKPAVPPTPSTKKKITSSQWPEQTVTSTEQAQDIVATSNAVFWLSQSGDGSYSGAIVSVYRFEPIAGEVSKGPSTTGFIGFSSLTVASGWLWTVVGVGDVVVVKRIDPSTLAVVATRSLAVKDGLNPVLPLVYPVVAATTDGPLWVAGDEDLWD